MALALTAVTAALASLAAHFAPGSQDRASSAPSPSPADQEHRGTLPRRATRAIFTWLESFTHAGTAFVLVLAIAAG